MGVAGVRVHVNHEVADLTAPFVDRVCVWRGGRRGGGEETRAPSRAAGWPAPLRAPLPSVPARFHMRKSHGICAARRWNTVVYGSWDGVKESGSVALSLCATVHPLHTTSTEKIGASISETATRPNPKLGGGKDLAHRNTVILHCH